MLPRTTETTTKTIDPHAKVPSLSHTMKDLVRHSRIYVEDMALKFILKVEKLSKMNLWHPKIKIKSPTRVSVIYRYKCDMLECDEEYIGETARTFGERFKEHLKAPSPIYDHSNITGHSTTINNFSIVGNEEHNLSRLIKESMYIRVNDPSLNKNIGKYHLPHIWDEVLVNITELKMK